MAQKKQPRKTTTRSRTSTKKPTAKRTGTNAKKKTTKPRLALVDSNGKIITKF